MIEFNNRKNIVLIGMAACGKSTIGVLIAKALDMTFIDTDLIMQQKYGKLLGQLLEDIGSKEFIIKESNVICSLDCTNSCISTGGSAVYSDKAMNYLKQIADIDIKSRGIVIDKGKTLFDVYNERKILYSRYADYTIEADDKSIEELVTQIISLFTEESKYI